MTPAGIIAARRTALIELWKSSSLFQVQVDDPQSLGTLVHIADDGEADVAQLGRRRQSNVVIATRTGDPHRNASVWVAAGYDGYRSAYVAFVREVYKIPCTVADLAGFDADHLLNRARSPQDSTFIRLEAVSSAVNQAWGSLYERAASSPQFHANRVRERRNMSWMVASKLADQRPPNGPDDRAGIDRLVTFWRSRGFPDEQARHGIVSDLALVFGRPRGGVVQPSVQWI